MNVAGVVVNVMFVTVALVGVMDVSGFVAVVLVSVALVDVVVVKLGVMLVAVTLVNVVNVAGFVAVVLVGVALVDIVMLHLVPPCRVSIPWIQYVLALPPRDYAKPSLSIVKLWKIKSQGLKSQLA